MGDVVKAFALIGKGGAAAAFSSVYLYTPELFPTQLRNIAMGTASMCGRVSAMAAPYVGGPMVRVSVLVMASCSEQKDRLNAYCSLLYIWRFAPGGPVGAIALPHLWRAWCRRRRRNVSSARDTG